MAKDTKKRSNVPAKRSENVVAMQHNPPPTALTLPENLAHLKVSRVVTKRNMKFPKDAQIFVKFVGPIVQAPERAGRGQKGEDGTTMKAPKIADVINLAADTGEIMTLVIPAVLESELNEKYPGDAYVDRMFAIQSFPRTDEKRYRSFLIAELSE